MGVVRRSCDSTAAQRSGGPAEQDVRRARVWWRLRRGGGCRGVRGLWLRRAGRGLRRDKDLGDLAGDLGRPLRGAGKEGERRELTRGPGVAAGVARGAGRRGLRPRGGLGCARGVGRSERREGGSSRAGLGREGSWAAGFAGPGGEKSGPGYFTGLG